MMKDTQYDVVEVIFKHYRIPNGIYYELDIDALLAEQNTMPRIDHLWQYEEQLGFVYPLELGVSRSEMHPALYGGAVDVAIHTRFMTTRAISYCSLVDLFDMRLGREIALGRALKALSGKKVMYAQVRSKDVIESAYPEPRYDEVYAQDSRGFSDA